MKHKVYSISYRNKLLYWGRTSRPIVKRQYEHNYNLRKGKSSPLYDYLNSFNCSKITLKIEFEYPTKVEAKRREMYMILQNYFDKNNLLQKVPSISDR